MTDGHVKSTKISKRFANKKVRNAKDLPTKQRNAYKKCYNSYDIHDYIVRWTLQDAIDEWDEEDALIDANTISEWKRRYTKHAKYENIDAYLQATWYKYYFRK